MEESCCRSSSGKSEKPSVRAFADVDLAVIAGLMPDSAGNHTNDPLHPIVAEMAALHVGVPRQLAMLPPTEAVKNAIRPGSILSM